MRQRHGSAAGLDGEEIERGGGAGFGLTGRDMASITVSQRAGIANQTRAFLLERGIAVRRRLRFLRAELPRILAHKFVT